MKTNFVRVCFAILLYGTLLLSVHSKAHGQPATPAEQPPAGPAET